MLTFATLAIEESASAPVSMSSVPNSARTGKKKKLETCPSIYLYLKKQHLLQQQTELK